MSERINGYSVSIYEERDKDGKFVCYTGAIDLGYHPGTTKRNRPKRKGRNKTIVRDKLRILADEIDKGIKTSRQDTVLTVVTEFVDLLERQGRAPSTIRSHRKRIRNQISLIGHIRVADLTIDHVEKWLAEIAPKLATISLRVVHNLLSRALDRAVVKGKAFRNVSRLAEPIRGGKTGRESKSLNRAQVDAIMAVALTHRFAPYVVLAITSGLRVDELDALTWADLDLGGQGRKGTVSVVRADRTSGDTKTEDSKRALELSAIAARALRVHRKRQRAEFALFGKKVSKDTPVFTEPDGTPYHEKTARRDFRRVLRAAGIANPNEWTTRETRTTFVSIMSDAGVRAEDIADMCGHDVKTLYKYYRKQLKPRLRESANVIDTVFGLAA
jgi:integrase